MSLLNPVLLPPNVKAYLSQGERFIKWDDVSRAGALPGTRQRGAGLLGSFAELEGWFMSSSTQAPMWLDQATVTTV